MKRVFFALCACVLWTCAIGLADDDKKLDTPPPGIAATTATLSAILKSHAVAVGRIAPGTQDTRRETWGFTKAGLPGIETLVRRRDDYYARIAAGPIVNEYGRFFAQGWHRGPNGVVSPSSSDDYTSFEMLLFMQAFDDAADPKNDVKVLGEVTDPQPAYILEVHRAGYKHPEWVFYDKKTGLIDRVEQIVDGTRTTTTYDDYRATKGLTQPWHVHFTDGTSALDYDFTRKSLTIGGPVDAREFAMPASSFAFMQYSGKVALPATVVMGESYMPLGDRQYTSSTAPTLVVRLMVNGRGLDFAVSAAVPHSLIDFDVAQQLGLSGYGQVTRAKGDPVPYTTIIPQATIGGLTLKNFAVEATPFHYHANDSTKVVGLIGFDVLSGGVYKIDYVKSTFELNPPNAFGGNAPVADTYMLPIDFDNGYPFFKGNIDQHEDDNILFDNDFDWSFVFGGFVDRYPESVKDVVTGKQHTTTVIPFADSKGFGKNVSIWLGNVPDIHFGPAHFLNFHLLAADGDMDADGRDVDAVMGGDLLRYYDIYLDYPHSRVYLKPNAEFFKVFKIEHGP